MSKCKVCLSSLRKEIESQIINGISYIDVESFVKSHGGAISHMSIKRHNDSNHIEGFKRVGNPDNETKGLDSSEVDSITNDSIIEIPRVENDDDLKAILKEDIRLSAAYLGRIVRVKLENFMQGRGKFPQNEIRAFSVFIATIDKTTEQQGQILNINAIGDKKEGLTMDMVKYAQQMLFGVATDIN